MAHSVVSSSDYVVLRTSSWCPPPKYLSELKKLPQKGDRWKTSWTVSTLWAFLSILVAFTCTTGFVETEWFVRENLTLATGEVTILTYDRTSLVYTLGMFNVCYRDYRQTNFHCHRFGMSRFPSDSWQGTCLLYGAGCVLQGCGAIVLVFILITGGTVRRVGAQLVSHAHVIAGFLQTTSLLLYPLILDTHVGRLHCGDSAHAYGPDHCRVGWAYVASTAGTLLTFYCPFLAYFSFYKVYDDTVSSPEEMHLNPNFLL